MYFVMHLLIFFLQIQKLFNVFFFKPVGILCLYTFSTLANTQVILHTHTHPNSVVVLVCVAMAACCCSDVVEMLHPHTAPNVPMLLLASRYHMGAEQPIKWEEHFV